MCNFAYIFDSCALCVLIHSVMSESLIPRTAANQAPLSTGFPRQECCSGLPFPSLGDLPNPAIKPAFLALQADSLPLCHLGSTIFELQVEVIYKSELGIIQTRLFFYPFFLMLTDNSDA